MLRQGVPDAHISKDMAVQLHAYALKNAQRLRLDPRRFRFGA